MSHPFSITQHKLRHKTKPIYFVQSKASIQCILWYKASHICKGSVGSDQIPCENTTNGRSMDIGNAHGKSNGPIWVWYKFLMGSLQGILKLIIKLLLGNFDYNDSAKSQICTWHDRCAVVPCAKLWHNLSMNVYFRATRISTRCELWLHSL